MKYGRIMQTVAAAALMVVAGGSAQAGIVFDQGFETDTSGWFDQSSGWAGTATRVGSGTGGVASFAGSHHAVFTQTSTAASGGLTGPFTRFDGYRSNFPSGGYVARNAVYLDTSWSAGEGFDYAVASSSSSGGHRRDFIFHVTKDTSSGSLLVGGSNNTNFDPREDLETINNFEVVNSGWYIFEHVFRDNGGVLAVDLNLRDAVGGLLFTETRSDGSDTIPGLVGGNRYGWFTNIDIADGIAVDSTQLEIQVPEPGAFAMFVLGFTALGIMRRRRSPVSA